MKKLLAVFFGLFLILVSFSADTHFVTVCYANTSGGAVYSPNGDIAPLGNPDGMVNVGDALVALRFALGLETPTQEDIQHGDIAPLDFNGCPNPDGEITVGDALVILRVALGLITFSDCAPTRTTLTISLTGVSPGKMLGSLDVTIDYDEDKVSFSRVAPGTLTQQSENLMPNDNGDAVNARLTMDSSFDGGVSGSVMVFTYDVIQPNIPSAGDFAVTVFSAYDINGSDAGLVVGNVSIDVVNERGLDTSFLELEDPGTYTGESTFEKKDNVYELTENETISVDENSNTITLYNPAKQYSIGDIIIGDENTRFAKKIISVSNVNGKTVMEVETPYLTDIFNKGSFSFSVTPDWSKGQFSSRSLLQKPANEYFTPSKIKNRVLHRDDISSEGDSPGAINLDGQSLFHVFVNNANGKYKIDWEKSSIMGMTIYEDDDEGSITEAVTSKSFTKEGEIKGTITKGVLNVCPTIDGDYEMTPPSAWCQMDLLMTFDAEVEVVATGTISFEMAKKILPKISVLIVIPTTPPLYVSIELEISAGFEMGSMVEGKAIFYYHSIYSKKIFIEGSKSNGFSYKVEKDDFSEDRGVDLTAEGSIWAKLSLKPRIDIKLYKALGPFFELEPYIKAVLTKEYGVNGLEWKANEDDLYLGIAGRAGLGIDLYIWSKDYSTPDLFNINKSWDLVPICIKPQTPTLSVSKTEVNEDETYTVSWNPVDNASGYILQESTNSDFSGATSSNFTSTSNQFSHTVSTDTRYYYRVKAENEPCNLSSNYSSPKNVLVRNCIKPQTPTLSVSKTEVNEGDTYTVSWTSDDNASRYILQESTSSNFSNATSFTLTSTSKQFSHTVSSDTRYYYQVKAENEPCSLSSNYSSPKNVLVRNCIAPGKPTLSVSKTSVNEGETYTVSWTSVNNATRYILQESTSSNFSNATSFTLTSTSKQFSHTVSSDTRYYYKVKAENEPCNLSSNYSNSKNVLVRADQCAYNTPPTAHSVSLYGYGDSNQLCVGDYFAFTATGSDPDTVQDIETIHARIKNMSTGAEYTETFDAYPQGSSTSFTATRVLSRTVGYVGRYCIYVKFLDKCGNWSNEVSVCVWSSDCDYPPPVYY